MLLVFSGCEPYQRVVRDDWAVFAENAAAGGAAVTFGGQRAGGEIEQRRGPSVYTVFLVGHEGDDRMHAAFRDAAFLRGQLGVPDVRFADADGVTAVYAGRFRSTDDKNARRIVKEALAVRRGEEQPFADAKVIEVRSEAEEIAASPLDLRGYRGRFGYTLQVGFFDDAYPKDRREAAETWARLLRDEDGVEAFYYHGPNRSVVTVGLFTRADFVRRGYSDAWGPRIVELHERYPHNVGNGMTLTERGPDGDAVEQASCLVRIPN